jgi:hypothetical protein
MSRPIRRARKWIGAAPAAFRPYRRPALIERRIAAVLAAVPRVDRAPASAGPRRLAPLRARPALGVNVGEQQSHYCDTEQNKTDRAYGSSPSPSFRAANAKGGAASPPSKPMNSRRCISRTPSPRTMRSIAGRSRASQQKRLAYVRFGSFTTDAVEATRACLPAVARKRTKGPTSRHVRFVPIAS